MHRPFRLLSTEIPPEISDASERKSPVWQTGFDAPYRIHYNEKRTGNFRQKAVGRRVSDLSKIREKETGKWIP